MLTIYLLSFLSALLTVIFYEEVIVRIEFGRKGEGVIKKKHLEKFKSLL